MEEQTKNTETETKTTTTKSESDSKKVGVKRQTLMPKKMKRKYTKLPKPVLVCFPASLFLSLDLHLYVTEWPTLLVTLV